MEAPRETTPPLLQAPTAKERKYDRQLRLWAASGQRALEESHVLLVVGEGVGSQNHRGSNSSVAGSETIKNLVLPCIGSFTIADSAKVSEADLGVNFFLEAESLGKSRAVETTRLLEELNPDVRGRAESRRIESWLSEPDSLRLYNLIIICAPLNTRHLERFYTYAQKQSIPVMYVQSTGFYSSFSIQLPSEFPIIDTHPDPDSTQDLRLLAPFTELSEQVESLGDISTLSDHDHGHIPYLLILLYYLNQWKSTNSDKYPATFKEKTEFRTLVRSGARTNNAEGGEENFDEACAAVLKSINPPSISSGCRDMFALPQCRHVTPGSANFWIVANAVKKFYEANGGLPLPGSLPDMKAQSSDYIRLQNVYKAKARADVAEVTQTVRATEERIHSKQPQVPVPQAEIEQFCKNAAHVKVLSGKPLPQTRLHTILPKHSHLFEDDMNSLYPIFFLMSCQSEPEFAKSAEVTQMIRALQDTNPDFHSLKVSDELTRASGAELHNISSVTGGMVAQEAIKLLTRQYVPVNNTCIFDGIQTKIEVMDL